MVVSLDPKNECVYEWVTISCCKRMWGDVGPVLPPSHSVPPSPPVEAHDGDDRIPRLPAQTRANRPRIRGESWASYFTLCRLVIVIHTQAARYTLCEWIVHFHILFSLCLQSEFPLDIAVHSELHSSGLKKIQKYVHPKHIDVNNKHTFPSSVLKENCRGSNRNRCIHCIFRDNLLWWRWTCNSNLRILNWLRASWRWCSVIHTKQHFNSIPSPPAEGSHQSY